MTVPLNHVLHTNEPPHYHASVGIEGFSTMAAPVQVKTFTPKTSEARLLVDAAETINGERQDMYGDAEDSFASIANYWQIHLKAVNPGIKLEIRPRDVAAMMVLFKLAREANSPKRDNRLDGAGYFGLMERCVEAEG